MPSRSSASHFGGVRPGPGRFVDGRARKRAAGGTQRLCEPAGSPNPSGADGVVELFPVADIASASPMFTRFAVRVEPDGETIRVLPVGELDMASGPELQATLEEVSSAGFERVVLDLRGLRFMDVHGLRLIVSCHALAQRDGFELSLIAGPRAVQRVFELTDLHNRLPFRPA